MIIRSLNVALPKTVVHNGKPVETAIFKEPVEGPIRLRTLGFEGDEQGDKVHHGGPDKAALIYAHKHYDYWERTLGRPLGPAAFGENLTVDGLSEETVRIGDVYRVGDAIVQVSQPRVPCFKVNVRQGVPDLLQKVRETGFTGIYLRVREEGLVTPGGAVELVRQSTKSPTVAFANWVFRTPGASKADIEAVLAAEGLAAPWVDHLQRRLASA